MGQAAPVVHTLMDKHSSAGKHNAETNGLRRVRKQCLVFDGRCQAASHEMGRSGAKREAQKQQRSSIFEAGQVTNISYWDLASSEKGGFPGCLYGSQANGIHSLECPG